jgi:homogentisate 1,2-dioxygenase
MGDRMYMTGFGSQFESEAVDGALPKGRNSPQRPAHGLYAEQLSGTAFTAPRSENRRSWLYRMRPTADHRPFQAYGGANLFAAQASDAPLAPNRLRWDPPELPAGTDFVDGLATMLHARTPQDLEGCAVHVYSADRSMERRVFVDADGELLLIPQQGTLDVHTELGRMKIAPGSIGIIPRGMKFRVGVGASGSRGYVAENYGQPFRLPDLGPIGANGLANPRDFETPFAAYEDSDEPTEVVQKSLGHLWTTTLDHSPLDVVAWHGNYAPYKYDLRTFSPVGAILFDHPDPSIFTVMTAPSGEEGTANVDFVIFPERWSVAEHSFRPPWYHMNIMSEFMGLIYGQYDAKPDGFVPGGISLHNCMLPHGPDATAFEKASSVELKPVKLTNTLAFMFETRFPQHLTSYAASVETLQTDYIDCWSGLDKKFTGKP